MKSATISANSLSLHGPMTGAQLGFGASDMSQGTRQASPLHLTPRQREVLKLLCEGMPNKLICRQLNIAAGTVKVHIGVILRELGVTSRLQAVVAASRQGLLADSGKAASHTQETSPASSLMKLRTALSGTVTGTA
jgi:DNA-binding NarL/FixJ family response regulator